MVCFLRNTGDTPKGCPLLSDHCIVTALSTGFQIPYQMLQNPLRALAQNLRGIAANAVFSDPSALLFHVGIIPFLRGAVIKPLESQHAYAKYRPGGTDKKHRRQYKGYEFYNHSSHHRALSSILYP